MFGVGWVGLDGSVVFFFSFLCFGSDVWVANGGCTIAPKLYFFFLVWIFVHVFFCRIGLV